METKAVELVQNPILKNQIAVIGQSVTTRLNELNLENQIVTEETVSTIKKLRADLNKEHAEYNGQFKTVSDAYMSPLNEVKALFKSEISEKFASADSLLKDKIGAFETQIKDDKKARVKMYFVELCTDEKIDFVDFETVIPEINLSTTEKKYKDVCNDYITKVVDDLNLINSQEFSAEILVEYKSTLNASKSITTVVERKAKEKEEIARKQQAEIQRRKRVLGELGFVFMDITNAFEYDSEIYIKCEDIEKLPTSEFTVKVAEFQAKIADKKQQALIAQQASEPKAEQTAPTPEATPVPKATAQTPAPAVEAPTVEVKEEIFKAKFEVTGTRAQLLALSHYMKSNAINYTNIQ